MASPQQERLAEPATPGWRSLGRAGGVAALILVAYSLLTMVQLTVLGGPPNTATEAFDLLQHSRIVGLLRLDLPTTLVLPSYYVLFLGLFAALQVLDRARVLLATVLAFVGVTLVLATPTALSMMSLSDRYAAANIEQARNQLLAAGEALLASDMWHGTGAIVGGMLTQIGAVLICMVMLRSPVFGRKIAWLGIVMHGFDLVHIAFAPFVPVAGVALMVVAGPLYPIWLFLVGRRLLRLATLHEPASSVHSSDW